MKRLLIFVGILVIGIILISGCSSPPGTATPSQSATATSAKPPTTSTQVVSTVQPQRGGVLRIIQAGGSPQNLGYYPTMSPGDSHQGAYFYLERMLTVDAQGNYVPVLATSWDADPANKTLTWHLRQGVKFHDGTDWNAEAARWNYQQRMDAGVQAFGNLIKSIDILDSYTLRFNLSEFNARMVQQLGWAVFLSPTSIKANGNDWARLNAYGTGPFRITDYKRDTSLTMERFKDYWRSDRPLLDGIQVRYIPDVMTASASLQAGEADLLLAASMDVTIDLQKKGFNAVFLPTTIAGGLSILAPDSLNPTSVFANQKVRQAVEYAIDRPSIAKALGYGHIDPLTQMALPGAAGFNPNFKGRPYDPQKAKQLLTEAGYPNGFSTTLFSRDLPFNRDYATAIQGYFNAIGIQTKVDICDGSRFASLQNKGWKDGLMATGVGIEPYYINTYLANFGALPTFATFASLGRSAEYTALADKVKVAPDLKTELGIVQQMIGQAGEDAMMTPLFVVPTCYVAQTYVHTTFIGTVGGWNSAEDWLGKK